MYGGNFGSNGMWIFLGICAVVGFFSAIYFLIKGIIWVCNHIQIV